MTASEILNIVVTVGICQLVFDLLANNLVYKKDAYQRACGALERAKWKLDKAEADFKKNAKHAKRLQRAKDDYGEHRSHVAQRHSAPTLFSSFFFLILVRILGTEYGGKVMAILPFSPINLIYRITARGLDWSDVPPDALNGIDIEIKQAASYLTIYILAGMSVKFYVNKAFGTPAPIGADEGLLTMMESPAAKKMMGVDTEAE